MKSIVCYGDSNTYGYDVQTQGRLEKEERWTGILQNILGLGYNVIEEGLCHRTTVWEDPTEEYKSGKMYLRPCLESHVPFDLVVVMLGTNDLKSRFSLTAADVSSGMECLIKIINNFKTKSIIVVPAPIDEKIKYNNLFHNGSEKSRELAHYYKELAEKYSAGFLDAGEFVKVSEIDGVHLDKENHRILAEKIAETVLSL